MKVQKAFVYGVMPKPLPALTDVPVCTRQEVATVVDTLLP